MSILIRVCFPVDLPFACLFGTHHSKLYQKMVADCMNVLHYVKSDVLAAERLKAEG